MKLAVLSLLVVTVWAAEKYTTKYDNIDLDVVLNNERLYKKYFECLTMVGRCTPDGKELKESLPDALATDCTKCSEKQKKGSNKVISFMTKNKVEDFEKLQKIYDPDGVYKKKNFKDGKWTLPFDSD